MILDWVSVYEWNGRRQFQPGDRVVVCAPDSRAGRHGTCAGPSLSHGGLCEIVHLDDDPEIPWFVGVSIPLDHIVPEPMPAPAPDWARWNPWSTDL
jgi:hypothetical protein